MEDFLKYLQYERRLSENTFISYSTDLEQFSKYLSNQYSISPIQASYTIIRSWIALLGEEKLSAKSIGRKIATLRSYYKFLLKEGKIVSNPTINIKTPKVKKRLPVALSEVECFNMLENIPFTSDFPGIRDQLMLELLYGAGLRLSELINTSISDVDIYNGNLTVTGKGSKQRIIPLNKKLLERIKVYINHKKEVFSSNLKDYLIVTNEGKKTYPVFIYRTVTRNLSLVTTADKKSPHVLRHSFATHLLNKGADINAIKELLGHSNLAATQVYTHNSPEKLKAIFDQAHPKS